MGYERTMYLSLPTLHQHPLLQPAAHSRPENPPEQSRDRELKGQGTMENDSKCHSTSAELTVALSGCFLSVLSAGITVVHSLACIGAELGIRNVLARGPSCFTEGMKMISEPIKDGNFIISLTWS